MRIEGIEFRPVGGKNQTFVAVQWNSASYFEQLDLNHQNNLSIGKPSNIVYIADSQEIVPPMEPGSEKRKQIATRQSVRPQ